jgi:periplasmic divalent cation tolerance protein
MPQTEEYLIVFTTCPDTETAEGIARFVVEEKLAACVTILPQARSVYRWQGALESSDECMLVIKTHANRYAALERALKARHPYELPEVIAVPIVRGLTLYLSWIHQMVSETLCD